VTNKKMEKLIPPTVDQALEGQQKAVMEKIMQTIDENNIDSYKSAADELLSQKDASTVVAAILKMMTKEPDTTPVRLTEEKPLPQRRDRKFNDRNNSGGGYKGKKSYSSNSSSNSRQRQGYSNKRSGQSSSSSSSYSKSNSYR